MLPIGIYRHHIFGGRGRYSGFQSSPVALVQFVMQHFCEGLSLDAREDLRGCVLGTVIDKNGLPVVCSASFYEIRQKVRQGGSLIVNRDDNRQLPFRCFFLLHAWILLISPHLDNARESTEIRINWPYAGLEQSRLLRTDPHCQSRSAVDSLAGTGRSLLSPKRRRSVQ